MSILRKRGYNIAYYNPSTKEFVIPHVLPSDPWPGSGYRNPDWSPNGNQISYIDIFTPSDGSRDRGELNLIISNKDGSSKKVIIVGTAMSSCWLSSGEQIAYLDTAESLRIVNLKSKSNTRIAEDVIGYLCHR